LLARSRIGRIAYVSAGTARIAPVNIMVCDGELVFQVGTGGLLGAIVEAQLLSLEVGEVDGEECSGWSVVVTGHAQEMPRRPDRLPPSPCSWLRSDAARLIRLTPLEISGRRLTATRTDTGTRPGPASRLPNTSGVPALRQELHTPALVVHRVESDCRFKEPQR
jgi:hypothetical protein